MKILNKDLFKKELEWFEALKKAQGHISESIISLVDYKRNTESTVNFLTNKFKDFSLEVQEEDIERFKKIFSTPDSINYYTVKDFIIKEIEDILVKENESSMGNLEINLKMVNTYNDLYFNLFMAYRKLHQVLQNSRNLKDDLNKVLLKICNNIDNLKLKDGSYYVREHMLIAFNDLISDAKITLSDEDDGVVELKKRISLLLKQF